jgi:hypothetical protein
MQRRSTKAGPSQIEPTFRDTVEGISGELRRASVQSSP